MKTLVLGATGMLGSTIYKFLKEDSRMDVVGTSSKKIENLMQFDALSDSIGKLIEAVRPHYVINCIGKIKPEIDENHSLSIANAIFVNSQFPHLVAQYSQNSKVIQIATDCVYSGHQGQYRENDLHDAVDVYGKTKSLGEVHASNFLNLRCSIIGREIKSQKSLLEWFLNQQTNAKVRGFSNHLWNGVTTLSFAKIAKGIIVSGDSTSSPRGTFHLVPHDTVTKERLLNVFAEVFRRRDINIERFEAENRVDRTLDTHHVMQNNLLWENAGYPKPPLISEMIEEYSVWLLNSK